MIASCRFCILFYLIAGVTGFVRRSTDTYPMVYVLLEGYYRQGVEGDAPDSVRMSSTVTLITIGNKSIVVDTGTSNHGFYLKNVMQERHGIRTGDISLLIITHTHPDHYQNALEFYPADQLVFKQYVKKNEFLDTPLKTSDSMSPLDINELTLLYTPGHTATDIALIVRNFNNTGKSVAIVGDLFLDRDDNQRLKNGTGDERWARRSDYPYAQRKYRKLIGCQVDFIIPGHGAMFEVNEQMKNVTLDCYSGQTVVRATMLNFLFPFAILFYVSRGTSNMIMHKFI